MKMAIKPPVHLELSTDNSHDNLLFHQQRKSQLSQYVKSIQEFQSTQTVTNPYQVGMTSTSTLAPKFGQNKLLESTGKIHNQKHLSRSKSTLSLQDIDGARHSMLESTLQSGFVGLRGRPFTVSKVGNNGKIYLRPKILPVRESLSSSSIFTPFPPKIADDNISTPSTYLNKSQIDNSEKSFLSPELHDISKNSKFTNTRIEISPRSLSIPGIYALGTDEPNKYTGKSDKQSTHKQFNKTNSVQFPTLEVSIPSYRLGFDPIDCSSPQHPDSTIPSKFSLENTESSAEVSSPTLRYFTSKRESENHALPNFSTFVDLDQLDNASLHQENISRGSSIVPEMFDKLMLRPLCEHPTVVQYTATRQISAATPARLVAEITSPSFVDYSLLSDFFLTFRSFLGTSQLLKMLIARLKWALLKKDSTGTIVRVRTFVALRHWLLNYFVDDFLMDFELRKLFCELLNDFVEQIKQNPHQSQIPFQITGELKKCWRIVCATFWDSADSLVEMGPLAPIFPGEYFDPNKPKIAPKIWISSHSKNAIDESESNAQEIKITNENSQFDNSHLNNEEFQVLSHNREEHNLRSEEKSNLPKILISEEEAHFNTDYLDLESLNHLSSYSMPQKLNHESNNNLSHGKNNELRAWNFKQNARFSDSYRGCSLSVYPAHKIRHNSTELLTTFPPASAILRANLFPPGQPFVDVKTPLTPTGSRKEIIIPQSARVNHRSASAISGPGMKKLLGNMRRALRDRAGQVVSSQHIQGCLPHVSPHVNRSSNINKAPDLSESLKSHTRNVPSDISMRIDFLGVEVAKDFKEALEEGSETRNSDKIREEYKLIHHTAKGSGPQDTVFKSFLGSKSSLLAIGSVENSNSNSNETLSSPSTNKFLQPFPLVTAESLDSPTMKTRPNTRLQPSCGPTPPITPPNQSPSSFMGITTPNFQNIFERCAWDQTFSVDNNLSHYNDSDLREDQKTNDQSVRAISTSQALETPTTNSAKSRKQLTSFQSNLTRWTHERSFDATTISGSEFGDHDQILDLTSIPSLLRPLRRRPGCNLRSVNNLEAPKTDLRDAASSTDSWASEVSKSLYSLHPSNSQYDDGVEKCSRNVSLGQLAGSHQEVINSSFVAPESMENGAYILAQIPDDDDDDGGIESTLLKLEGRFQKRKHEGTRNKNSVYAGYDTHLNTLSTFSPLPAKEEEGREIKSIQDSKTGSKKSIFTSDHPQLILDMDKLRQGFDASSACLSHVEKYTRSIESRSLYSRPEKDTSCYDHLSDYGSREAFGLDQHEQITSNILHTPELSHGNTSDSALESDEVDEHQSKASTNDSLSWAHTDDRDLISLKFWENSSPNEYTNFDLKSTTGNLFSPIENYINPKEHAHPLFEPLSSSIKMPQALEINPEASYLHSGLKIHQSTVIEDSPAILFDKETEIRHSKYPINPLRSHRITESYRKMPPHMPFILAHDSDILAQQFTLVEKDALNEIDWKDLIEIQCGNPPSEIRSWVKFLRSKSTPQGIEIIMTRFNLMVKWAVSECILIQNLNKRVDCLVKLIHIADSCRKRRNFATMTQITTALISQDLTELTHTWSFISSSDIQVLEELKTLILPSQNFHNLRAEMEGASVDQGCIPFLGIYIEELALNHQNPIFMETSSTMEPLVNFERCRTDAMIIKTLLRLIEASQQYKFSPIEGVIERCIWIAALSDEEIANYRKLIQG
ncbi:guanine nucleotide exchange factor LTE1 [Blumeria hordei DH14]|uniref:Guanine nucleotide exchange factor LTE1 n=1 Tax=Blumeria graminis f. sp. hordei (strain DH14) TaxID=546991 RepID=N1J6W4_BLUG1|nr:guanine nucleotide exchange factor LTE1 [Blumeria hordei DH14]